MANKTLIVVLVIVLAVVIVGAVYMYSSAPSMSSSTQGRAVFSIADAAANMGTVSSVRINVDKVEAHSEAQGWITVSSTPRTYNLLQLKSSGDEVVLADTQLGNGTYDQVRLDISDVTITDANGTHEAKLPSGELKIDGGFDVAPNSTEAVKFDFITDRSLHMTGNGQYIFAPAVHLQSRDNATLEVDSEDVVHVSSGHMRDDTEVGMDENGTVGIGLHIPDDVNISIGDDGHIKLGDHITVNSNGNLGINSDGSSSGISGGIGY